MTPLLAIAAALKLSAVVTAIVLARRREEHQPIAVWLALAIGADVVRETMRALGATPSALSAAPLDGRAFALAVVGGALYLVWPAGLAGAALAVCERRRAWLLAPIGWALAVALIVVGYPHVRGDRSFYLAASLVSVVVAIVAVARWGARREVPAPAHVVVILAIACELASVLGSYWHADPWVSWRYALAAYAVLFGLTAIIQVGGWPPWTRSSSSPPS